MCEIVTVNAFAGQKWYKLGRAPAFEVRGRDLVQIRAELGVKNVTWIKSKRRALVAPDARIGIEIEDTRTTPNVLDTHER